MTLSFTTYATVVAAQDTDVTNQMVLTALGTSTPAVATDADYALFSFIISDDSTALDAYTTALTVESEQDAATDYTDGYAIVGEAIMARGLWETESSITVAGSDDTTKTHQLCVTGTISAEDAKSDGTDALVATSCAEATVTCVAAADGSSWTCTFAAAQGDYAQVNAPTNQSTPTGITWSTITGQVAGFQKAWMWSGYPAATALTTPSTGNATLKVGRFFPKLDGKKYDAADLRFSGAVTGQIGYMMNGATDYTWATGYTWAGAAQVASVAAAAAVVALTF